MNKEIFKSVVVNFDLAFLAYNNKNTLKALFFKSLQDTKWCCQSKASSSLMMFSSGIYVYNAFLKLLQLFKTTQLRYTCYPPSIAISAVRYFERETTFTELLFYFIVIIVLFDY